jgi:predicted glycosyltransferase
MSIAITPNALDPEGRLRRSRGRGARASCVSSRLTEEELRCLEKAAADNGKAVSEWAREVLLEAARRTGPDVVLVELVATRMLLVNMLKMIGQTRALPEAEYTKIHAEVQKVKRRIARELAEQTERLNTTKES